VTVAPKASSIPLLVGRGISNDPVMQIISLLRVWLAEFVVDFLILRPLLAFSKSLKPSTSFVNLGDDRNSL